MPCITLGFAPGRDLPQISNETLKLVKFNITIAGNGRIDTYIGKIVGLTYRINSVLVPYKFLKWANAKYSSNKTQKAKRLILTVNDPSDTELLKFIKEKGYETNEDKLKSGKLNLLFNSLILILSAIGGVITLLSFIIFFVAFKLFIAKAQDKINLLLLIGYHPKTITNFYFKFSLILFSAILTIVTVTTLFCEKLY